MSAPQPPANGDEPSLGADAAEGGAATPAETPPARTSKAAPRKAAPRKPATTGGTGQTAARTSTAAARTGTPAVSTGTAGSAGAASASETAPTQVLPATDLTEVLPAAGAATEVIAATGALPAPVTPESLPEQPQPVEPQPTEAQPVEPQPVEPQPAEPQAAATEPQPTEPPPAQPQEPPTAHQAAPPARTITEVFADRLDNDGFFSALFDFTFTRYVTRKLAGPVYVVGLVLIGLSTILALIYWLGQAIATHSFLGAFVFLFGLMLTVVGTALAILLLRVAIEVFVAIVAIAENTRPRRKQGP